VHIHPSLLSLKHELAYRPKWQIPTHAVAPKSHTARVSLPHHQPNAQFALLIMHKTSLMLASMHPRQQACIAWKVSLLCIGATHGTLPAFCLKNAPRQTCPPRSLQTRMGSSIGQHLPRSTHPLGRPVVQSVKRRAPSRRCPTKAHHMSAKHLQRRCSISGYTRCWPLIWRAAQHISGAWLGCACRSCLQCAFIPPTLDVWWCTHHG